MHFRHGGFGNCNEMPGKEAGPPPPLQAGYGKGRSGRQILTDRRGELHYNLNKGASVWLTGAEFTCHQYFPKTS